MFYSVCLKIFVTKDNIFVFSLLATKIYVLQNH